MRIWPGLLLLSLLLGGCTTVIVPEGGTKVAFGFVRVTAVKARPEGPLAGTVSDVTVIGLGGGKINDGGFVSLGYFQSREAAIRNDVSVLVRGDVLGEVSQGEDK